MEELLKRIQSTYEHLPQAQRAVAEYIVENYRNIPFQSVTSMAKNIGVSDTTIIKYCMQIGFDGFGGFKKMICDHVKNEVAWYNKIETQLCEIDREDILSKVAELDIENIRLTMNDVRNKAQLEKLLESLDTAENIYVAGFRTAAMPAQYFSMLLGQQGYKTHVLIPGLGDYYDIVCRITPKDLLIPISFSRYSQEILNILKAVREIGAPCVAITDSTLAPLALNADYSFICAVKSYNNAPSLVSCFTLLNAVLTAAAKRHKESAKQNLKRVEDMISENNGFFL